MTLTRREQAAILRRRASRYMIVIPAYEEGAVGPEYDDPVGCDDAVTLRDKVEAERQMGTFDSLPQPVRDYINFSQFSHAPTDVAPLLPRWGADGVLAWLKQTEPARRARHYALYRGGVC